MDKESPEYKKKYGQFIKECLKHPFDFEDNISKAVKNGIWTEAEAVEIREEFSSELNTALNGKWKWMKKNMKGLKKGFKELKKEYL